MEPYARREDTEVFWILALDAQHQVIWDRPLTVTRGVANAALVHPRESAVFWALFLVCWTLLTNAGYGWVGWVLLAAYAGFAAPFLIIQTVLIADLFAYLIIGKIFAYPAIEQHASDYAKAHPERVTNIPWPLQLFFFLADASPLSCSVFAEATSRLGYALGFAR